MGKRVVYIKEKRVLYPKNSFNLVVYKKTQLKLKHHIYYSIKKMDGQATHNP